MSSYCATCGRQRNGTEVFCAGCGAEFTGARDGQEAPAADEPPAVPLPDPTRADPVFGAASRDQPAAGPDPFASWYQPQRPGGAEGPVAASLDETWQPTQTVHGTPTQPTGFPPPPIPPYQPAPPGSPYPPVPPGTGSSGRGRGGLFVALAAVVVLAAGGGAYAIANSLGKHSGTQPPSQPGAGSTTPAGGTSSGGGSTPAGGGSSSGASPKQAGGSAGSPTPSPTLSLVAIGTGVTASAAEPQVETLLSHYFHGINTRDYAEYASTLSPAEQAKQSQSTFESGYATTTDSAMTLTSLTSDGAAGLVATVTFTSRQSPAQSVDHSACNAWTLNFYLVPQGTGYLIGPAPSGYQPSHSDC